MIGGVRGSSVDCVGWRSKRELPVLTARILRATRKFAGTKGCGDYSILAQMKKVLPTLGIPKEKFAFVSGWLFSAFRTT